MKKTRTSSIQMVDIRSQYLNIKEEVDIAIQEVIDSCAFINGPAVKRFSINLEKYLDISHVIPCANGTDALQIAMMALDLKPGAEVIVPGFTYVATAEVISLLGLTPVMVDVDPDNFNITTAAIQNAITDKTEAVVPVNLFGQCSPLEEIRTICDQQGLWMIEDNAQAIGSNVKLVNGATKKSGTIGHIGSTSFYPSKNLGAYGDGGALYTEDDVLAAKMRKIANHGQSERYYHDIIGCNSRLDGIQAAILDVKLKYLDKYNSNRQKVADLYDYNFINIDGLKIPERITFGSHVFHQYTLRVLGGKRDDLKSFLHDQGIPSMIYYPVPLYRQRAFSRKENRITLPVTELLCEQVLSLPIHSEMNKEQVEQVTSTVLNYYRE